LGELASYEAGFQKRMIQAAVPIQLDIVSPSAKQLNAIVNARPLQGKLLKDWLSELEASRARRVRDAVRLGMVEGETTNQIVRRIRGTKALQYKDGILQASRRGTEAMVRTAVAHTASAAREKLYEENTDIIANEIWVSTLDTRTCLQCAGLDGKIFDVGKGPRAPIHQNCRCIRTVVTKSWKELGFNINDLPESTRASMNGQVPATQTYGAWLNKQPAAVQDEALGPTRGKLFRKGDLDVKSFTSRNGDELTLSELAVKEANAFDKAGVSV